jgi:hypothetical protein
VRKGCRAVKSLIQPEYQRKRNKAGNAFNGTAWNGLERLYVSAVAKALMKRKARR